MKLSEVLVALVYLHFSNRIDGRVTYNTLCFLAWRIKFLFGLSGFFLLQTSFSTFTLSCQIAFFAHGRNAPSNWITPFLKLDNLVMRFFKVQVTFTAAGLRRILKDCEKILVCLPAGSVFMDAKAVQKTELTFMLSKLW